MAESDVRIEIADEAIKKLAGVPTTFLAEPSQRTGDFLHTLDAWGELPERLTVTEAVRYFSSVLRQNPAALTKVIERAILNQEMEFFGLLSTGEWREGMVRMWLPFEGKPRVRQLGDCVQFRARYAKTGTLHREAMAVRPISVVRLLVQRGRKIPSELAHLVSENPSPTVADSIVLPVSRQQSQNDSILATIRSLGYKPRELPESERGKPGVKAEVRAELPYSKKVFDKAWERLLESEIGYVSPKLG